MTRQLIETPPTMSGFCQYPGAEGHTHCRRPDCACACHLNDTKGTPDA